MTIFSENLRFPSGRTVKQVKKDAARLSKERNISHAEALNAVCEINGLGPTWDVAIETLKRTGGHAYRCHCCEGDTNTRVNPLLVVAAEFVDESSERVHLSCAQHDGRYDFCRFCGDQNVYLAEEINDAGECSEHEGESALDYPEEDLDSFVEYLSKDS